MREIRKGFCKTKQNKKHITKRMSLKRTLPVTPIFLGTQSKGFLEAAVLGPD